MSSPRHSPPPSAAAPKPRGILKNATSASGAQAGAVSADPQEPTPTTEEEHNRLAWDESNLTLHEIQRQQQDPRMKIDEPKTPFVRSASLGPMNDDFDLDTAQQPPQQQDALAGYFTPADAQANAGPSGSGSRRSSAADVLAANTKANAGGGSAEPVGSAALSAATSGGAAAPLDEVSLSRSRRGNDSRSPSFTLPGSRRSSAVGDRSRDDVRQEMRNRSDGQDDMQGVEGNANSTSEALDDESEDEEVDEEAKAKQDEFARKRNAHYGNEAEAMKIAAALASQEDDEDDDDDDDEHDDHARTNSIPPLPNGRRV